MNGEIDKKKSWTPWILGGGVTALAVGAYLLLFMKPDEVPLKHLARALRVEDPRTLTLNVPPLPGRFPGLVLQAAHKLPTSKVADPPPANGPAFSLEAAIDVLGRGQGSLGAAVFQVVLQKRLELEMNLSVPDAVTLEADLKGIRSRLDAAGISAEEAPDYVVVIRAWHGTPTLKLKRKQQASADAWAKLTEQLGQEAKDSPQVELKVGGGTSSDSEVSIALKEPTVFAFQVARAAEFYRSAASAGPARVDGPVAHELDHGAKVKALEALVYQPAPDAVPWRDALEELGPEDARRAIELVPRPREAEALRAFQAQMERVNAALSTLGRER